MTQWIYGKNPIIEAVRAGRRQLLRLYHLPERHHSPELNQVLNWAKSQNVPVQTVSAEWLEGRFPGAVTQGWVAEVQEFPLLELASLLAKIPEGQKGILLALDQIQDPQNLGAILRTAEAVGVQGVLLPERRSCPLTPVVAKAAAGAIEYLNLSQIKNLTHAIRQCQESGFWVVGTSAEQAEDGLNFSWPDRTLLILGSEGKGMRRLVRESCDFLIHLPLAGRISSLNVSATAAVCLYLYKKFHSPAP